LRRRLWEDVRLGELIGRVLPSPLRDVGVERDGGTAAVRPGAGPSKEAQTIDEPVLKLIA
jgi:hypothetical protein